MAIPSFQLLKPNPCFLCLMPQLSLFSQIFVQNQILPFTTISYTLNLPIFFFNSMSWVVVKLLGLMLSLLGPGFNPWLGTDDSISLTAEPKQRKLHLPIFKIRIYIYMYIFFPSWLWIFPQCSDGKESACNVGDPGLTPGSGRSLGEGHGNPLQYSCLKNSTERRAWRATVHRVAKSLKHRSN